MTSHFEAPTEVLDGRDIDLLARQVAKHIAAMIDPDALWSLEDVGAFLQCSKSAASQVTAIPSFPRPGRINKQGKFSHPRWRAGDVKAWWQDHKE